MSKFKIGDLVFSPEHKFGKVVGIDRERIYVDFSLSKEPICWVLSSEIYSMTCTLKAGDIVFHSYFSETGLISDVNKSEEITTYEFMRKDNSRGCICIRSVLGLVQKEEDVKKVECRNCERVDRYEYEGFIFKCSFCNEEGYYPLKKEEINRIATAFEHEDIQKTKH